ncbi:MAG TPA: DHH family phosphoesterase [Kofleriaceae bacterium]|nr:DHH family phosphoesterase [Kofleriaceae bacterium]
MTTEVTSDIASAASRLASAERVLLTCHRGPDGDSIGSMVALGSMLRAQGKRATLFNPDLVPRRFKWMPLVRTLAHRLKPDARYDLTVVVDCGDRKLLGDDFPPPEVTGPLLALDHHASAAPFGELFVSDPNAASVGVLVARIADLLGWPIDEPAALGIFVSLVSDTGSFCYSNTNPEAFALAARLVASGVDPWTISERMNERVPLARYKLLAAALSGMELVAGGKLCFMIITHDMVKAANAAWEHTEGMVNYARSIDGVECGVLITPAKRGGVRVSLRSKARVIDAGAICAELGGGGHPGAAGCAIEGSLEDARARIQAVLEAALAKG